MDITNLQHGFLAKKSERRFANSQSQNLLGSNFCRHLDGHEGVNWYQVLSKKHFVALTNKSNQVYRDDCKVVTSSLIKVGTDDN